MLDHNYQTILPIQEGDIILDVGASEGFFTASIIDKAKFVILIEPSSFYRNKLKKLFENNNKILIYDKAMFDNVQSKKLYLRGWGSSLIIDGDMCSFEGIEEVETNTIDNIISSLNSDNSELKIDQNIDKNLKIDKIDFMKMDIEGAEIEALIGATKSLENKKIKKMVIASYHYRKDGTQTWKWIGDFLRSKGYTITITEDKLVHASCQ